MLVSLLDSKLPVAVLINYVQCFTLCFKACSVSVGVTSKSKGTAEIFKPEVAEL